MLDPGAHATLEQALRAAIVALGSDEGSLLLPVNDGADLEFVMCCTRAGVNSGLIGQRVGIAEGLVGMAAQTGETQIGAPIYKGVQQAGTPDGKQVHPASVLAAPLFQGDQLLGVMTLVSFDPAKRYTMDDAAHYESLAALLALILHKQTIIDELSGQQAVGDANSQEGQLLSLVGEIAGQSPQKIAACIQVLQGLKELTSV